MTVLSQLERVDLGPVLLVGLVVLLTVAAGVIGRLSRGDAR